MKVMTRIGSCSGSASSDSLPSRGPVSGAGCGVMAISCRRSGMRRRRAVGDGGLFEAGAGERGEVDGGRVGPVAARDQRSEEHTSELQSLMRISYAVFCLKNKKTHN